MAIERPYYSVHQILTGQYAQKGKFILKTGADYEGGFHVLPNGQYFTGYSPSDNSQQIFVKRFDITKDVASYNNVKGVLTINYLNPIPVIVLPTLDDYHDGFVYRYFVNKRNNPLITIIEIDVDQYNKINTKNQPGINGAVWNKCIVKWKINGSYIYEFNDREITRTDTEGFRGLRGYLKNLHEFAK